MSRKPEGLALGDMQHFNSLHRNDKGVSATLTAAECVTMQAGTY